MTNPNDSAFINRKLIVEDRRWSNCESLTKREYFAVQIMQGFCSRDRTGWTDNVFVAGKAVQFADALIKALNAKD